MKWNIEEQPIFFPKKIRKIYEKIYKTNRLSYTNWIGKITEPQKKNIDWWMTKPTLRNPYTSNLLNYITVLETLEKIKEKNLKIITSSFEIKDVLNKYFNKKFNLKINVKKNTYNFFKSKIFYLFKVFIFQLFIFSYVKIFIKKKAYNNKLKYTFIDTFVTLNKELNEGFYPAMPYRNNEKTLFVPTIIHTLKLTKLIKSIKKIDKKNYLFKEHYLTFGDLFFSFFHFYRKLKFLKNSYSYKKYNLSKIVNEEIISLDNYNSAVVGILNYKFFENISNFLIVVKSVNWFENQVIDRGWNLGFRTFFKKYEKNSFGYQNFTRHYNLISFSPSISENQSKVTPEKIIIISKYFHKITKEFYKKQISILGPTNRFKNLQMNIAKNFKNKSNILLILSGIYEIDRALVKIVRDACLINKKIKVFVKDHPIMPLKKIISSKDIPTNFIPTNENLNKLLKKSLISITSGPTSAIQESYNMNNFLLLPDIEVGTKINVLRLKLNLKKTFIVENKDQLLKKINFITKNKNKLKKIKNKSTKFFEMINKRNVQIFY